MPSAASNVPAQPMSNKQRKKAAWLARKAGHQQSSESSSSANQSPRTSDQALHSSKPWGPQLEPYEYGKQQAASSSNTGGETTPATEHSGSPSNSRTDLSFSALQPAGFGSSRAKGQRASPTQSTVSVRSTTTALSQRPVKSSGLTVSNTSSRPSSQISISKATDKPAGPSNSLLSRAVQASFQMSSISTRSATPTVLSRSKAPAGEVTSATASISSWANSDAPVEAQAKHSSTTISRRQELLSRQQPSSPTSSDEETEGEDVPDPRMFMDYGRRYGYVEDIKRRFAAQQRRRAARAEKAARKAGLEEQDTADDIIQPAVESWMKPKRKDKGKEREDAEVGESSNVAQEASVEPAAPVEEVTSPSPAKTPEPRATPEVVASSSQTAITAQAPVFVPMAAVAVSDSPAVPDNESPNMDWEVIWNTTASFKTIRPRVSGVDPNLTKTLDNIREILEGDAPYLPASLRQELEALEDFQYQPDSAYGYGIRADDDGEINSTQLASEMEKIVKLVKVSNKAQAGSADDRQVHSEILELIFDEKTVIQSLDQAQICYQFLVDDTAAVLEQPLPTTKAALMQKQMEQEFLSGFAVGLKLEKDDPLHASIKQYVKTSSVATFSPSLYRNLRNMPVGMFVGSASLSDSAMYMRTRLFVWAASWFKRVDSFRRFYSLPALPVLPLLAAESNTWKLFFACRDNTDSVEIIGPVTIGSTAMVQETYKLVAVLQILGEWLHGTFRAWLQEVVSLA